MANNTFLARFAQTAVLVPPEQVGVLNACLTSLESDAQAKELIEGRGLSGPDAPKVTNNFWFADDDWRANYRPYKVVDGVLQIPVKGVLLHDFPWAFSFATGYVYIWKAFERGLSDPEVKGIALVCHSPGGEAAGCFDLVDKMWARINEKPVVAFASEAAYSGAYAVASVANKIVVSRTGGVGSIGVYTSHVDLSKMLEMDGVRVTLIFAGAHKVDGNPFEQLPADVRIRMQERVNYLYGIFTSTVARNRAMSDQAVRATEALTYSAPEAIAVGLADSTGSLEDSLTAFTNAVNGVLEGDEQMTVTKPEAVAGGKDVITQANVDAARTEGEGNGRKAERARIAAILALDSAKTRRDAASEIALTTDLSTEQADAILKKLPETKVEAPAATQTPFAQTMNNDDHPNVGGGDVAAEMTEDQRKTAEILEAQRGVMGTPKKPAKQK